MAAVRYTTSFDGVTAADLAGGFFEGWPNPPSPHKHLKILQGSQHVVLAVDDDSSNVVGFITAISDGVHAAFVPLLEVLPEHRGRGIGSELVRQMMEELRQYRCVDLMCDAELQSFYNRFGMQRSVGMLIRNVEPGGGAMK